MTEKTAYRSAKKLGSQFLSEHGSNCMGHYKDMVFQRIDTNLFTMPGAKMEYPLKMGKSATV